MNIIDRQQLAELVKRMKPRLRRDLRFVPEEITAWEDRDFLAVTNRNRSEGVLIFEDDVVAFQLQKRKPNKSGRTEAIICDLCSTWQRGSNSAIISFVKANSTISFLCCADLDCSLHVRGKTPQAKLSRVQLREHMTSGQRVERLRQRLAAIMRQVRPNPE